jgi:hypothetical protein
MYIYPGGVMPCTCTRTPKLYPTFNYLSSSCRPEPQSALPLSSVPAQRVVEVQWMLAGVVGMSGSHMRGFRLGLTICLATCFIYAVSYLVTRVGCKCSVTRSAGCVVGTCSA